MITVNDEDLFHRDSVEVGEDFGSCFHSPVLKGQVVPMHKYSQWLLAFFLPWLLHNDRRSCEMYRCQICLEYILVIRTIAPSLPLSQDAMNHPSQHAELFRVAQNLSLTISRFVDILGLSQTNPKLIFPPFFWQPKTKKHLVYSIFQ